ncbi:hypothetical protein [Pinirhizobacter soli]|uniref:hypothetical protein n=1 Tax=Pinirhizobacter soli TaxID=2786953 RepID=UPI002029BD5D|nr:hypothetical protein [Pinirhizobacter soli]
MPIGNTTAHQARASIFQNAMNVGRHPGPDARSCRGLLGVSNSPLHRDSDTRVPERREIYQALSIPMNPDDRGEQGSRVATGSIGAAMKRHPWATTIVATTAVFAMVGFVARQASDSSQSAAPWLDSLPQPQSLNMPGNVSSTNSPTVVGVCEQAIGKFPRTNGAQVNDLSITQLRSIKSDAESILGLARSMVRDSAVGFGELGRAARCSGVSLREQKVEAMIAELRAKKSHLEQLRGELSIDMAERILALRMRTAEIDRKLSVLTQISQRLFDATVAINRRMLEIAG